jgi:hypothetical protein
MKHWRRLQNYCASCEGWRSGKRGGTAGFKMRTGKRELVAFMKFCETFSM